MIELISSASYQLIEASWHTSAVFAKFYLFFTLADSYQKNKLDKKNLRDRLLIESRVIVPSFVVVGALTLILGYELRPFFPVLSETIALVYLGYLFWEY